jgi:hypothetical protein
MAEDVSLSVESVERVHLWRLASLVRQLLMGVQAFLGQNSEFQEHWNRIGLTPVAMGLEALLADVTAIEPLDPVYQELFQQIEYRRQIGLERYDIEISQAPGSIENWLQDALEETIDQGVYLTKVLQLFRQQEAINVTNSTLTEVGR